MWSTVLIKLEFTKHWAHQLLRVYNFSWLLKLLELRTVSLITSHIEKWVAGWGLGRSSLSNWWQNISAKTGNSASASLTEPETPRHRSQAGPATHLLLSPLSCEVGFHIDWGFRVVHRVHQPSNIKLPIRLGFGVIYPISYSNLHWKKGYVFKYWPVYRS